jgi:acyl carrier protein
MNSEDTMMDDVMTTEEMRRLTEERNFLCAELKGVIVDRLDLPIEPDWITNDQPLFGRGLELDSVDALELAVGIDDVAEVNITDEQIGMFGSINRVVDYIGAHRDEIDEHFANADELV